MASVTATTMGVGTKLQCNGCGAAVIVTHQRQEQHFLAAHGRCPERLPASETHYGLGDVIAMVAEPIARIFRRDPKCTPCEERKRMANAAVPRVWRR